MSAVLLIGSGGREHALAWKLGLSPKATRRIAAPGNDGFPAEWERWKVDLSLKGPEARAEFERLASRAKAEGVALVVVGPDNALAEGIVDVFCAHGIRCFGPTAGAARIESSKAFSKDVMKAAGVPTAKYFVASSAEEARKILRSVPWNSGWVVKADGLALGKGVRVCAELDEALRATEELSGELSGESGGELVIEERLSGEELSWLAFCDGESCALFEPARDHKSLFEDGRGPNTGGMGAFSPVAGVPETWKKRAREEVFVPVLRELKKRGTPFRGVLYAGLMCDFARDRFWVLEFNARFGDPEAQVLLARMSGDLWEWCDAVARGELAGLIAGASAEAAEVPAEVPMKSETAVVVVGAASGYPGKPEKGKPVAGLREGLDTWKDAGKDTQNIPAYFVAGAALTDDGSWVTSGGRVLGAMGMGNSLREARTQAYGRLEKISFAGMQFRRDIGQGADQGAGQGAGGKIA